MSLKYRISRSQNGQVVLRTGKPASAFEKSSQSDTSTFLLLLKATVHRMYPVFHQGDLYMVTSACLPGLGSFLTNVRACLCC